MRELSNVSSSTSSLTHADPPACDLWIDTDHQGRILEGSAEALSTLLGYTARSAPGRLLPIMLLDNRPNDTHFHHVMLGHPVDRLGAVRPRERRPIPVVYRISLAPDTTDSRPILRWTFQLRQRPRQAGRHPSAVPGRLP